MADAVQTATPPRPLAGRVLLGVGVIAICTTALAGGLVAAIGPDRAMRLFSPSDSAGAASEDAPADEAAGHGQAPAGMTVRPFKEIIVNITANTLSGRRTSRFLKLNLALVYDATLPGAENIDERVLFIRDGFQDYLRQLTETDLQGSIGLVRLKSELLRRARAISDSDAPQELLIADLIIQ